MQSESPGPETPQLFVEEFLCHRKYLRAIFHLYPAMRIDRAILDISGYELSLDVAQEDARAVLSIDALTAGIATMHQAVVKVGAQDQEFVFEQFVAKQLHSHDRLFVLSNRVRDVVGARLPELDVLEIGSRKREATKDNWDLRSLAKSYVGMDILSGENVDVVGDAHRLSSYFQPDSFDFVYSQWVWEHLAMPWVACAELNKVLRVGGEAFILTNHTMGLHDLPWDFFRFSESCWISLFNEQTGFGILSSALGDGMRIVPHRYHAGHAQHEGGLGYLGSACHVVKKSSANLHWDVDPAFISSKLSRPYPEQIVD